jgi:hypothetical protein
VVEGSQPEGLDVELSYFSMADCVPAFNQHMCVCVSVEPCSNLIMIPGAEIAQRIALGYGMNDQGFESR